MKFFNSIMATLGLGVASIIFASNAHAYTTFSCGSGNAKWSSSSKTLYAYTGSFPAGSQWRSALIQAVQRLNENAAGFTFNISYTNNPPALGNGRSEIWIANISPPGVTNLRWNGGCNLTEADIRMDSSVTWTTSTVKTNNLNYGGFGRPFQTTLLHELGHAMGLGHEADEYNIMGQDWDHIHNNGSTARAYFGEDASDGSVALYGSGSTQDLGVVHWKRTGASGAYSAHGRTKLYDASSGSELSYNIVNNERRYNVYRGQNVRVELTFENNGNSYQYQDVGYYLSTNSYISPSDTLLKERNIGLSPDNVLTSSYTVKIPSNATCNKNYWLGAYIDKDYSLSENIWWNNGSGIPVRVKWNLSCVTLLDVERTIPELDPIDPVVPITTLQLTK